MCEILEAIEESDIRMDETSIKHLTTLEYLEWKLGRIGGENENSRQTENKITRYGINS